MKEIWKDIKGYEGIYQVSNRARIKRLERIIRKKGDVNHTKLNEIIMKQSDCRGYKVVGLTKESKKRRYYVHRLVATAFLLNEYELPCINHKDGCKSNNNLKNLEWCTAAENRNHALLTGLARSVTGSDHGNAKFIEHDIKIIFKMAKFISMSKIALIYGVQTNAISDILQRKTWKHVDLAD
jgi:hypothetical protein